MKIKLDENLAHQLAVALQNLSHEVDTVFDEGLVGHSDVEIWQAAQNESRFLITQDLDFSNTQAVCSRFTSRHSACPLALAKPDEPH